MDAARQFDLCGLSRFTEDGLLPPGDYTVTFTELRESLLVRGPDNLGPDRHWDVTWRAHLVDQLERMVNQLFQVGIEHIYVDGSFVEEKDHPHDVDGYFECDLKFLASGRLEQELNRLESGHFWTWDSCRRTFDSETGKRQLPMWHARRVELFPHVGQLSGIRDEFGHELTFPVAFRRSRQGLPKGIVKIVK